MCCRFIRSDHRGISALLSATRIRVQGADMMGAIDSLSAGGPLGVEIKAWPWGRILCCSL